MNRNSLEIRIADLDDPRIVVLLARHLATMRAASPPQSVHAEIKSMHTRAAARRRGAATALLAHILATARAERLTRLSLETGSQPEFLAARALYSRYGFEECPPFGDYVLDPNSVFMTLELDAAADAANA